MNNIYVDEFPENCWNCELGYQEHSFDGLRCKFNGEYCNQFKTSCPLKPLSDRLAEERKKVVQEIGTQLGLIIDGQKQVCCDGDMTGDKNIMAVLDQIERGE